MSGNFNILQDIVFTSAKVQFWTLWNEHHKSEHGPSRALSLCLRDNRTNNIINYVEPGMMWQKNQNFEDILSYRTKNVPYANYVIDVLQGHEKVGDIKKAKFIMKLVFDYLQKLDSAAVELRKDYIKIKELGEGARKLISFELSRATNLSFLDRLFKL